MRWLTPEQHKVYMFILECFEKRNTAPTIQEIADATESKTSLAHRRVLALEKKRYIERLGYGETRSIRIPEKK